MKKILFRADGNAQIGAGHIMRCLSIGEAARDIGMECVYVTADDSFESLIQGKGFSCRVLRTFYSDMESELAQFETILKEEQPQTIVIDSYAVTDNYLKRLKQYGITVYIDDLYTFAYPVDMLVNYNIYAEKKGYESLYSGSHITLPDFLLGTEYVPLRQEFQLQEIPEFREKVSDILVSVGGADPEHMALKIMNGLIRDREIAGKCQFHFVIGSLEPDKMQIRRTAASYPWIVLHENVQCMSELMLKMDLAISAAGSTLYELSSCGVPAITYVLADNQISGALAFERYGIMVYAGDCRKETDFLQNLCREIMALSRDVEKRKSMRLRGREAVGGKGAERIIREIDEKFFTNMK